MNFLKRLFMTGIIDFKQTQIYRFIKYTRWIVLYQITLGIKLHCQKTMC